MGAQLQQNLQSLCGRKLFVKIAVRFLRRGEVFEFPDALFHETTYHRRHTEQTKIENQKPRITWIKRISFGQRAPFACFFQNP
jgi:hypothetical protein